MFCINDELQAQRLGSQAMQTIAMQRTTNWQWPCQCGNRKEDELIKTGEALTLDKDEASQLRELLDLLEASFPSVEIADTGKPEIREAVWSLQKKLKRIGAASGMGSCSRCSQYLCTGSQKQSALFGRCVGCRSGAGHFVSVCLLMR